MSQLARPSDEVYIGMPSAATTRSATYTAIIQPPSEPPTCQSCIWTIIFASVLILTVLYCFTDIDYPSFKVESVSVSLDNTSSDDSQILTAAVWELGFSVNDVHSMMYYDNYEIRQHYVFVKCMSPNWTGTVFKAGKYPKTSPTPVLFNATVNTILPHYTSLPRLNRGLLTLEFEVMLHVIYDHRNRLEVTCKNMTVAFLPNATKGIVTGGPRLCHVDDAF